VRHLPGVVKHERVSNLLIASPTHHGCATMPPYSHDFIVMHGYSRRGLFRELFIKHGISIIRTEGEQSFIGVSDELQ